VTVNAIIIVFFIVFLRLIIGYKSSYFP